MTFKKLVALMASKLTATAWMQYRAQALWAMPQGREHSLNNKLPVMQCENWPAHHDAVAQVFDDTQIQRAFACSYVNDVQNRATQWLCIYNKELTNMALNGFTPMMAAAA